MPRKPTPPRVVWRPDRNIYVIRYREGGQKRELGTRATSHIEAEKELAAFLGRRAIDAAQQSDSRPLPISLIIARYLDARNGQVQDPARIAYAASALLSWWGSKLPGDVRGATCSQYRAYRIGQGVKDGTVRRELTVLQAALNFAHREQIIQHPIKVEKPSDGMPRERWLTRDEAAQLLWHARSTPHLATFIRIGLATGQRKQVILRLSWIPSIAGGHVDLDANRINFSAVGRRQTNKRQPLVPISPALARHLRHVRTKTSAAVIEYHGQPVFNVKKAFAAACDRAGLVDVVPHTLRHSAITWACLEGRDPFQICRYFGVTMVVLERTYLHHHPSYLSGMTQRRK